MKVCCYFCSLISSVETCCQGCCAPTEVNTWLSPTHPTQAHWLYMLPWQAVCMSLQDMYLQRHTQTYRNGRRLQEDKRRWWADILVASLCYVSADHCPEWCGCGNNWDTFLGTPWYLSPNSLWTSISSRRDQLSALAKACVPLPSVALGGPGCWLLLRSHRRIRRQGTLSFAATLPPFPLPLLIFFCLVPKHQDKF